MAIEFRCTQCGKLLRTKDETAGKKAKCPECGTILAIPMESQPAGGISELPTSPGPGNALFDELQPSPLPSPNPFAAGGTGAGPTFQPGPAAPGGMGPPGGSGVFNPYASPQFGGGYQRQAQQGVRTGPPWERDGASFSSYIETVKQGFGQTAYFYSDMRREGFGPAFLLYMITSFVGALIGLAYQFAMNALGFSLGALGGGGADGGAAFGAMMASSLVGAVIGLAIGMICSAIGIFLWSGIVHLFLMMFGGANYGYEATFRVIAYTQCVTAPLVLIPICGQFVQFICSLVFWIIGLSRIHDTSGGKAAGAVLLPFVVCCGAIIAFYAFVIAAVVTASQ